MGEVVRPNWESGRLEAVDLGPGAVEGTPSSRPTSRTFTERFLYVNTELRAMINSPET
jgi:hypothetical protein